LKGPFSFFLFALRAMRVGQQLQTTPLQSVSEKGNLDHALHHDAVEQRTGNGELCTQPGAQGGHEGQREFSDGDKAAYLRGHLATRLA